MGWWSPGWAQGQVALRCSGDVAPAANPGVPWGLELGPQCSAPASPSIMGRWSLGLVEGWEQGGSVSWSPPRSSSQGWHHPQASLASLAHLSARIPGMRNSTGPPPRPLPA